TFESTRKYFRWPTRRCATHRSDPWPPPKRAAPGRRKSQPANEAALRWAIAEVIAHRLDRARWYAYAEIVQAMPEADREAVAALGKRARLAAA
ncbi:hypothetical protein NL388_29965, partial [Klebsiella pneumoniae]|nr:hypothetical protein [Klebsiella pneumoniae]